jgi:hypothetical protein
MLAAAGVAAAVAAAPAIANADVNWQVPLHGSTAHLRANGSAQYQSQPGQAELQIEVQHVRSLAGKTVTFVVAGKYFGSAKISALGQADVTKNTELRQAVPRVLDGTSVAVRTASGSLIAFGRF